MSRQSGDKSRRDLVSEKGLPPDPGFTWELLCIALLSVSGLGATAGFFITVVSDKLPSRLAIASAVVLLLLTLKLTPRLRDRYRTRQRLAVLSVQDQIDKDARPGVLYLRSFRDDQMTARTVAFNSVEQEMRRALFEIGPMIALAEPGNEPPDPGAARIQIPHQLWQEEVIKEMLKARLVIIRIGDSDGFWWEVREARRRVTPERLVFLIPKGKDKYEKFCQKTEHWLPCRMPEYKASWSPFGPHGGILYFEPDWTPRLQKFKTVWLRQTFWNLFAAMLKIGLRPVYEQLGVRWNKPPIQAMQVLYMLGIVLLLVFVAYFAYALLNNIQLML